jgi:Flp pilus assembly protein TadD
MESARMGLARAFLFQNRPADAEEQLKTVLHNQPKSFEAHNLLARMFLNKGNAAAAAAELHASLDLQINQPDTLSQLAWVLATDPHPAVRHGAEAVQLAQRACGLTRGEDPVYLGALAAAFAETGDFDKAIEAGKLAHDVALAEGRTALAETNNVLIELYRAHKPFREKERP